MINLPTGVTLSEADFNKFMSVFEQVIDKAVEKRIKEYKPTSVQDILMSKKLTGQQLTIAKAIFAGKNNKQISKELGVTESSIKSCITRLYSKFGVGSRVQFLALRG